MALFLFHLVLVVVCLGLLIRIVGGALNEAMPPEREQRPVVRDDDEQPSPRVSRIATTVLMCIVAMTIVATLWGMAVL